MTYGAIALGHHVGHHVLMVVVVVASAGPPFCTSYSLMVGLRSRPGVPGAPLAGPTPRFISSERLTVAWEPFERSSPRNRKPAQPAGGRLPAPRCGHRGSHRARRGTTSPRSPVWPKRNPNGRVPRNSRPRHYRNSGGAVRSNRARGHRATRHSISRGTGRCQPALSVRWPRPRNTQRRTSPKKEPCTSVASSRSFCLRTYPRTGSSPSLRYFRVLG